MVVVAFKIFTRLLDVDPSLFFFFLPLAAACDSTLARYSMVSTIVGGKDRQGLSNTGVGLRHPSLWLHLLI